MCLKVVSAMLQRCNYEGGRSCGGRWPSSDHRLRAGTRSCCEHQALPWGAGCAARWSRLPAGASCHPRSAPWLLHPVLAVDTRTSGQDALLLLRDRQEHNHQFDLVLSDVYMPGAAAGSSSRQRRADWGASWTPAASRRHGSQRARTRVLLTRVPLPAALPCRRHGRLQAAGAHRAGAGPAGHQ